MKKILTAVLCLILVISFAACGDTGGIEVDDLEYATSTGTVDIPTTQDQFNYLTGEYDLAGDRVGMRPYCVSVNNISDCWPQYGISQADIVIEIETEGGITRLMCLYADIRDVPRVGSVRSLRDQFIEAIYPVDPIIVHIGTSIYADRILSEHNLRTLDGDIVPISIYVDPDRIDRYLPEHTKFTSGLNIQDGLAVAKIDETAQMTVDQYFNFVKADEEAYVPADGSASRVTFQYSNDKDYDGDFRYDAATGQYLKFQRGQAQMDVGNNQQAAFDNVLLFEANIKAIDASGVVNVDYQAGGRGWYFCNGQYEEITWTKGDFTAAFEILRADGTPLPINPGNTMLAIMRSTLDNTVVITP